jgi:hypothetical protein
LIKLAHIINPVNVTNFSDLIVAQPITFESMRLAKNFSDKNAAITLCTTQYEEDHPIIPDYFKKLSNLNRSVLDSNPKLTQRKLPLIKDILSKLEELPTADYYIYTNVDIAIMPHFYNAIFDYIDKGHDAIVINRRRLSKKYTSVDQLPQMYSDLGKSHPGFDCFVFKKSLLSQFELDSICVGISFLEVTLVHNIFSFAQNPLYVPNAHLTFHIGMDVLVNRNNEFYKHNKDAFFLRISPKIKPYFSIKKFPYGTLGFWSRMLKWGLNPSLFFKNLLDLEVASAKAKLDEIRWRILQR